MRAGGDDPVQQVPVIGQQQQTRRVLVEPPNGRDGRVAVAPTVGKQAVDKGTRLLMGAGHAPGFVQHQRQARRRIERLPFDLHPVGQVPGDGDALIGILDHGSIQSHQPGAGQLLNLAPRAVTHIGQEAIEPERWRGLTHFCAS
jgi:hypothetical protein